MLWPGSKGISDYKPLPDSAKSTLSGDTIQFPNVSAYFSNNFREFVIPFYYKNYQGASHMLFPPLKINHPPEYAWTAINVNVDSTFIEEFTYPLRDSLYVNGFETNRPDGSLVFVGAPALIEADKTWYSKVTLRYYPSNILVRLIVWLGISISIASIFKLGKRIIYDR